MGGKICYAGREYTINCAINDIESIAMGGPAFLGFDFYLDLEEPQNSVLEFLRVTLEKYNKEYLTISVKPDTVLCDKIWSHGEIEACISGAVF